MKDKNSLAHTTWNCKYQCLHQNIEDKLFMERLKLTLEKFYACCANEKELKSLRQSVVRITSHVNKNTTKVQCFLYRCFRICKEKPPVMMFDRHSQTFGKHTTIWTGLGVGLRYYVDPVSHPAHQEADYEIPASK